MALVSRWQSGRDGAVDLTRPLRSEVIDRERREDGRDGVIHSFHRPERSVDVSGCRPDVAQEARPASVRVPQRVPEHSLFYFYSRLATTGAMTFPAS